MIARTIAALAAAAFVLYAPAQERRKIDFQLEHRLQHSTGTDDMVDLFVRGDADGAAAATEALGGLVKMRMHGLLSIRIAADKVRTLAASPAVHSFEFSLEQGRLLCDSMRVKAHVNEVHAGLAPLPQAYDGNGVVVGIIDTGLDVNHADFRNADGTTRVLHYWDQTLTGTGAPAGFGYGRAWTKAQIDAGQLAATDNNGHGTTVAGSATGNARANGRHKGAAPLSDIVVVNFSGQDFRAKVADAIKFVFDMAEAEGKPAVVNVSLGTYSGSHDGKDAAALFIDSLIAARPGRAVVCGGGNENGNFPFHLRTQVTADTTFTWFTTNANGPQFNVFPYPNLYFEAWADLEDLQNVQCAIGADRVVPSLQFRGRTPYRNAVENLGTVVTDDLVSLSGNTLGTVQYFAQQRGGQVQLQVFIAQPDTQNYLWRFMTVGSGRFDVWSITTLTGTSNIIGPTLAAPLGLPFPTPAEYPAMAHYVQPDNRSHIVDSWACSDRTLTVANYLNQVEYQPCSGAYINSGLVPYTISGTSSSGPTRDNRYKPDIAAPGDVTMAAAPIPLLMNWATTNPDKLDQGCLHIRNGGTSMASPAVAGAVALYLQKCPNAGWQQIRQAFLSTAWGDALTGPLPNDRFGYGRVHAFNALVSSNLAPIAITSPTDVLCSNETVEVSAPAGYDAYLWSNGGTGNPLAYSGTGPLSVVASSATGCAHSNALSFTLLASPPEPVITPDGALLTSTTGPSYQWFLDGQPINGATGQAWTAQANGSYTVEHTAANGCSAMSAPVQVLSVGVREQASAGFAAWPSPTQGALTVQVPASREAVVQVLDAEGRIRLQARVTGTQVQLPLDGLAPGAYLVVASADGQRWTTRVLRMP
jgi:hypothetical protein